MPIDPILFQQFAAAEIGEAREIAKKFRDEINTPLLNSSCPPLNEFCHGLIRDNKSYVQPIEKLRILVDLGANPNITIPYLSPPLECALLANTGVEFVSILLKAGASVNLADSSGNTAINTAVKYRRFEELLMLVQAGGNLNHKNNARNTVLTEEILGQDPSLDVVKLLLKLGADVNVSGSLHASLSNYGRSLHIVQTLIDNGADCNAVNNVGRTPLSVAVTDAKCPINIIESLVSFGAQIDLPDDDGSTPLLSAAASGHKAAVKFFLENNASVFHINKEGKSALHLCCKEGKSSVIPLIVKAGIDINLADCSGRTPLMYAVEDFEVTKAILKFGPDVNRVDGNLWSALMWSVTRYADNQADIAEILIKNGARTELSNREGNTALHFIAKKDSSHDTVKVLAEAGANVNATNCAGESPLMLCRDVKAVRLLIRSGADVDAVDSAGKCALIHYLTDYGSNKHFRVNALLSAKCDPNIKDKDGKTALMYAARHKNDLKSVKLLLEYGANLDLEDESGRPATAFADADNLMFLISAGAKPSSYEWSRLPAAIDDDNIPLASALLGRGAQMKLTYKSFIRNKKVLEKLASVDLELLRTAVVCSEPESEEQFNGLLAKFGSKGQVASDDDLPYILRKGVWPLKAAARKQLVLEPERTAEIGNLISYFDGKIDWSEQIKESILKALPIQKVSKHKEQTESSTESPSEYLKALLGKKTTISFSSLFKHCTQESETEFVRFWNDNALAIREKVAIQDRWRMRPIDAEEIRYLLARFDIAVLPGILAMQAKSMDFAHALRFVDVPACARVMSRGMISGSIATTARQWALTYPVSCTKGLIVDATSKLSKERSAAETTLRFLASNGHKKVVECIAGQFGDDVLASIAEILDQDHRVDFLPTKPPKMPKFWSPDVYPRPRLRSNNKALPTHAISAIASMMSLSTSEVRTSALDEVIEACDIKSLANFAWAAFEDWAVKGQKDTEWIFDSLTYFGDDSCARKLTPYIRNWPSMNGIARARKGLEVLATMGTDVALSQIQAISQKNKYQSVLESAQEMIKRIAVSRDLTPHQLEDRLVPDLGLSDTGEIRIDFGSRHFIGSVDATLKPVITDALGTVLKALPSPTKADDIALAKQSSATWSELCKELKPIAKIQLQRLELAMVNQRIWTGQDFKRLLIVHPLLRSVVKGLVWGIFPVKAKPSVTFIVSSENTFVGADGRPVNVSERSSIGIVHPLSLEAESLASWQNLFAKNKLLQPFSQLVRKTYRAIEDSENNRFGLNGATVESKALKGLLAMGWSPEVEDAGWIWGFSRAFASGRASIFAEAGVHISDYELNAKEQKIEVNIPETLNRMEFSETVRELMTLKK